MPDLQLPIEPLNPDLFEDVDVFFNAGLGVQDFRTRTAALALARTVPVQLDGTAFVAGLFERLSVNWDRCMSRKPRGSQQNFRWHEPRTGIAHLNPSPEVTLERALMRAIANAGRADWSNQVPLVSGISGPHIGKRRAVDLVHHMNGGGFELVELKVASNTPLFAALEILQYGLLWLLSRRDRHLLSYADRKMLDVATLHLSILAPRAFYSSAPLGGLAATFDRGVAALGKNAGIEMRFEEKAFSDDFQWPAVYSDGELLAFLDHRQPV